MCFSAFRQAFRFCEQLLPSYCFSFFREQQQQDLFCSCATVKTERWVIVNQLSLYGNRISPGWTGTFFLLRLPSIAHTSEYGFPGFSACNLASLAAIRGVIWKAPRQTASSAHGLIGEAGPHCASKMVCRLARSSARP